jgi:hypothetical protein
MKNKLLDFLKRYGILIILSLIYPLVMVYFRFFGNTTISKNALGDFGYYEFYIILILTALHVVYGCITYAVTKKILIPNAIPAVIYFLYFFPLAVGFKRAEDVFVSIAIFVLVPVVFSVIGTLATAGIYKMVDIMKIWNE